MRNPLLTLALLATAIANDVGAIDPVADHHIHIRSQAGAQALNAAKRAAGRASGKETSAVTADAVVASLDAAGIERATVLSYGYIFGMPELDYEDELARVRAENDFVASQTARHSDRLAGFCSVDPLADYALGEIRRCAADERLTGLKLHLANAGVDLRNPDHVTRLRRVFRLAHDLNQPLIVHLRTRNERYGRHDAEIFIRDVLRHVPGMTVQVAHLAGWSGMDEATQGAVAAFARAVSNDDAGTFDGLYFDTAETIIPESRAKGREKLVQKVRGINERTVRAIHSLGIDRILFGSDRERSGTLQPLITALNQDLPLAKGALERIARNQAPYFE